jgi:aminopeptidase N
MKYTFFPALVFSLGVLYQPLAQTVEKTIEHTLSIRLSPDYHHIGIKDQITLPPDFPQIMTFSLHRALRVSSTTENIDIELIRAEKKNIYNEYRLNLPAHLRIFNLIYDGTIDHPLEAYGKEQARGFRDSPGTISSEGVYLAGSTYWYPQFKGHEKLTFQLNAILPGGWSAVSQGKGSQETREGNLVEMNWESSSKQEEIFLIAAPFHQYHRVAGRVAAQVYLREPDEKLANKYLDATSLYLKMYEDLLGEYPYSKFALVENFWETGFGMPSFTLLGSKVIRLPFILHSSYPHEILHNWWGNGVYVDYASGNWCEGLTAYLADHLIKEQRDQGVGHRQQSLQKYTDYALEGRDFSLANFSSRHSSASEAVGYGKAMMLFHMIRLELGDELFIKALREFYEENRFKRASFADLRLSFEKAVNRPIGNLFSQWVNRVGAPALQLAEVNSKKQDDGSQLDFELRQIQADTAYHLRIPVAITLEGNEQTHQTILRMSKKQQHFTLKLPARPVRIDVDPEFDLFRALDIKETPPAFTQLFGSKRMLVVLPRGSEPGLKSSWQAFAEDLAKMGPDSVKTAWDDELETLPEDQAVAVLGWRNRYAQEVIEALSKHPVSFGSNSLKLEKTEISHANHAVALTFRPAGNESFARAFIAADLPESLPGLGRKLPHYHKYSYLTFSGTEPQNRIKGRWPVTRSPMTAHLIKGAELGQLKKREALTRPPAVFDSSRMMKSIEFLAGEELQGRGFGDPGLDQAADYISKGFREAGLEPFSKETASFIQSWKERGGEPDREALLKNVIGFIPAANSEFDAESVVIGAHYDHLGRGWPDVRSENKGLVHYGADDNASGVAILMELAQVLGKSLKPERNIVFAAFSEEESGRRGSKHYIKHQKRFPAEKIIGMINLDTVGRLEKKKLLVLGTDSAREWPHIFRGIGYVTGIPIAMVSQKLDSSDHTSFHEVGVPAVQLFSGANLDYHRPTDTAEKIDLEGLIKVATVTKEALEYLAGRKEPMNITLQGAKSQKAGPGRTSRKVSLGSIPDFTYRGTGYRLEGTVPGSPAERAGLKKGDIIIRTNGINISSLRDLSKILKTMQPGQKISITYKRLDEVTTSSTILEAK